MVGEARERCLNVGKAAQNSGSQVKGGGNKARQGQAKRGREVKVGAGEEANWGNVRQCKARQSVGVQGKGSAR